MKKLIFIALLFTCMADSVFAANENKISSVVLKSFKVDFANAANVMWTQGINYSKAAFTLNHQKMEAFYDLNGGVIAVSKSIQLDDLPINAKRMFAKRYGNFIVKEAIKFDGMNESSYYISAANEKETVILKVNENEDMSLFLRTKKGIK